MANTGRIPREIAMTFQPTDSYHEFGTDPRDESYLTEVDVAQVSAELARVRACRAEYDRTHSRKANRPSVEINPAALLHVPTLSEGTVTDHPRDERYSRPTVEGIDRADVSDSYREDFAAGRDGNPVSTRGGWENVPASNEVSRGAW